MLLTIDSSAFVAAFRREETEHAVCRSFLATVKRGAHSIAAPLTVLIEVTAAIRRRTGSELFARRVGNELTELEYLTFLPLSQLRARNASQIAGRLGLRGMDAIVVAVAHELRCPIVSLDREILREAGSVVEVRTIDEV